MIEEELFNLFSYDYEDLLPLDLIIKDLDIDDVDDYEIEVNVEF